MVVLTCNSHIMKTKLRNLAAPMIPSTSTLGCTVVW
ncbi:Uncharacterised protein [Vibrio cholerae]|nr:Uncharacterised protein [Vibrio cholerae]